VPFAFVAHCEQRWSLHCQCSHVLMKIYVLLGLTVVGLVALTPIQSKADDGFRIRKAGFPIREAMLLW